MKNLLLLLSFICLTSCSSDDDSSYNPDEIGITNYCFYYMDYLFVGRYLDKDVQVIYDGNKIVKLIGGLALIDPTMSYTYVFTKQIYKEISYSSNSATIVEKNIYNENGFNKQVVEFTSDGKLKYKISISNFDPSEKDTIQYFYQNGILKSYEKHNRRLISKSEIFYNTQADVDSIVTRAPNYITPNQPYFDPESEERIVRKFLNFDNQANPFKSFVIFDESFNRSLSAHNYGKWEEFDYDYDGYIIGHTWNEWTYIRENGIINFGL